MNPKRHSMCHHLQVYARAVAEILPSEDQVKESNEGSKRQKQRKSQTSQQNESKAFETGSLEGNIRWPEAGELEAWERSPIKRPHQGWNPDLWLIQKQPSLLHPIGILSTTVPPCTPKPSSTLQDHLQTSIVALGNNGAFQGSFLSLVNLQFDVSGTNAKSCFVCLMLKIVHVTHESAYKKAHYSCTNTNKHALPLLCIQQRV